MIIPFVCWGICANRRLQCRNRNGVVSVSWLGIGRLATASRNKSLIALRCHCLQHLDQVERFCITMYLFCLQPNGAAAQPASPAGSQWVAAVPVQLPPPPVLPLELLAGSNASQSVPFPIASPPPYVLQKRAKSQPPPLRPPPIKNNQAI